MSREKNKQQAQDRLKAYRERHDDDAAFMEEERRKWVELLEKAPDDDEDSVWSWLHQLDAEWVAMFDDDRFDVDKEMVEHFVHALLKRRHPKHDDASNLLGSFLYLLRPNLRRFGSFAVDMAELIQDGDPSDTSES